MNIQKIGGYASLANTFVMIIFIVLNIQAGDFYDPLKGFDAISASLNTFFIFYLLIIFGGFVYIPIVLSLSERMQDSMPNIARIKVFP